MTIKAPRGTNDILPPASFKWNYIEKHAHEICRRYNYQEIRTPIFEHTELFARGIGEATDIVQKEMYTFTDKSDRSITLRPEGTAPVARAFLEHKLYGKALPKKFFYFGPMFRYERPQAGRYRQFHQFGVEVIGSDAPDVDVEIITLGIDFIEEFGFEDYYVEINSIGCPECRPSYLEELKTYLAGKEELCENCQERLKTNPLRVLDCKSPVCQEIVSEAPVITDYLCPDCQENFSQVKQGLEKLKLDFKEVPTLVRGLDYYTNTVFEVKSDELGAQDAIFSGGRYNGLLEEIGDRDIPATGFALGLERLEILLEEAAREFGDDLQVYITTIGEEAEAESLDILHRLRQAGYSADRDYGGRSVGSQMKDADRKNSRYCLIIGSEELKAGEVNLRDMKSGEEESVPLDGILEQMSKVFEPEP